MISSLSHVALLVPSVEASARVLNARDIATGEPETFPKEGTKEIYVGSYSTHRGLLLLVEAISEGSYRRALQKRGPSLHHISVDVLNLNDFVKRAQEAGWQLHPASSETMKYDTAWLFAKGMPTLIEVQSQKELSSKPARISRLELPFPRERLPLFAAIGLGDVVNPGPAVRLTLDGIHLSFSEIAVPPES